MKKIFKYYLIVIFFLAVCGHAFSQGSKRNTLSVPKFNEITTTELLSKLAGSKNDTSKVWLLNKIAAIYWWRRSNKYNDLDSCMYYALQGRKISIKSGYQEGFNESTFLLCRVMAEQEKISQAQQLIKTASAEQQVRLNLVLGEHYINLPGNLKKNVSKGYPFLEQALRLSQKFKFLHWKQESQIAIGKYFFLSGDLKRGISYFQSVINYWHQAGKISEEAHWYSELGRYMPGGPENLVLSIKYQKQALDLYKKINDKPNMAYTADDIGQIYHQQKNLDSAQLYFSMAVRLLQEAKVNKLYLYYYHLSDVFLKRGNFSQALSYSLAALSNIEQLKDNRMKGIVYNGLGEIYSGLGDHKNSLIYFKLAMEQLTETGVYMVYYLAKNITDNLILQGKVKEAIAFSMKFEKENPAINLRDLQTLMAIKGNCSAAAQKPAVAERYFLKMIDLDSLSVKEAAVFWSKSVSGAEANYLIGNFYVDQKRYASASAYLKKFHTLGNEISILSKEVSLLQFKVDSASGNYIPAIKYYQKYSAYKDSMYNISNTGKLADMQIRYETAQKEKDITLLQKDAQLQQRHISQSSQSRNFAFAGILMLGLIIAIGYNRYRLKQNSYIQLELKQQKINRQNEALYTLNQKQQNLLKEKEWLVKEIHHRVKNNLQMMQSLLKSQSYYIDNKDATMAIKTSQRRMQAMSLVHEKLYLNDQMNSIAMYDYVHELLTYLETSFDLEKKITFLIQVEKFQLDIIRAIPVGLIINEVVTNSIKYAFPDGEEGVISIFLKEHQKEITLHITDNGIGLRKDFDFDTNHSFGMQLINGLVRQLDGNLSISSKDGLQVTVVFSSYIPMETIAESADRKSNPQN